MEIIGEKRDIIIVLGPKIRHDDFSERSLVLALAETGFSSLDRVLTPEVFSTQPDAFDKVMLALCEDAEQFRPSRFHFLLKKLRDCGKVLSFYTFGLAEVERKAGIPKDEIVYCKGRLSKAVCSICGTDVDPIIVKLGMQPMTKRANCPEAFCRGDAKPAIVLLGEQAPKEFFMSLDVDSRKCDLLWFVGADPRDVTIRFIDAAVSKSVPRLITPEIGETELDQLSEIVSSSPKIPERKCCVM